MKCHPREGEDLDVRLRGHDECDKKGPARVRRVFFIGGIEEAFLVGLCLDRRTVRKSEVDLLRVLWPLGRLIY